MVVLQLDPFLNELTSMFERSTAKGSVWVTLKRSSLKSKVQWNKLASAGETMEADNLVRFPPLPSAASSEPFKNGSND